MLVIDERKKNLKKASEYVSGTVCEYTSYDDEFQGIGIIINGVSGRTIMYDLNDNKYYSDIENYSVVKVLSATITIKDVEV